MIETGKWIVIEFGGEDSPNEMFAFSTFENAKKAVMNFLYYNEYNESLSDSFSQTTKHWCLVSDCGELVIMAVLSSYENCHEEIAKAIGLSIGRAKWQDLIPLTE